jgi:hypothetical protein
LIDPRTNQSDLFRGKLFAFLGHGGDVAVGPGQDGDEQGVAGASGNQQSPVITAAQSGVPLIQAETGLLLFLAVTGIASLGQERLYLLGKRNRTGGGRRKLGNVDGGLDHTGQAEPSHHGTDNEGGPNGLHGFKLVPLIPAFPR